MLFRCQWSDSGTVVVVVIVIGGFAVKKPKDDYDNDHDNEFGRENPAPFQERFVLAQSREDAKERLLKCACREYFPDIHS